jgi:putative ABC transport system ATP-binding protein
VALPLMLLGQGERAADLPKVQQMLDAVGLGGLGERLPQQLSGGQLQRVAIARALIHRPALLLADEPTGNLDPTTAARVMDALIEQTRTHGASLVLVTHSQAAAARADRVLTLRADGIHANNAHVSICS